MRMRTIARSLVELLRANIESNLVPNFKPIREGYQFFDLNVHMLLPTPQEVPAYLKALTRKVDGATIAHYGRDQSGMKSYDEIIPVLQAHAPRDFSVENKGLVTLITNKDSGDQTFLFRSEEVDETQQNLDVMLVGVRDYIPNPGRLSPSEQHDARRIGDVGRAQGALTYLQHFCATPTYMLKGEKTFLERNLPWIVNSWSQGREELFEIFDHVDAVEVFNGHCTLWMPPQNALSAELVAEYNRKRNTKKPVISCSNVRIGKYSIGSAGILVPSLDPKLTDHEIIEQLRDNVTKGPVEHKRDYNNILSFAGQIIRLKKERKKAERERIKRLASA